MLDIQVLPPKKSDSLFEFGCVLRPVLSQAEYEHEPRQTPSDAHESQIRFGYRAVNFRIRHHEVWDAFFPLYYLTRNGGPLFNKGYDRAHIRFEYPVAKVVRDHFVQRAADFGIHIDVEATVTSARLDQPTSGAVLAFGGGKDSRLILEMLRELGVEPTVMTARDAISSPLPESLVAEPIHGVLSERIMPSFMALGRRFYFGAGLGEAHHVSPWQQYYDNSSEIGRRQMSVLLSELGVQMEIVTPVLVLPYNLTQRILHDRYPELYAGQTSTTPGDRSDKNLHIALLKLYHDLPGSDAIDAPLFNELLIRFVRNQLADPTGFGYRDHRETIVLEMRAIIWRMREHPTLAAVRNKVPAEWDGPWIDYIHPYVDPGLDPAFVALYREHASTVDEASSTTPIRRVLA